MCVQRSAWTSTLSSPGSQTNPMVSDGLCGWVRGSGGRSVSEARVAGPPRRFAEPSPAHGVRHPPCPASLATQDSRSPQREIASTICALRLSPQISRPCRRRVDVHRLALVLAGCWRDGACRSRRIRPSCGRPLRRRRRRNDLGPGCRCQRLALACRSGRRSSRRLRLALRFGLDESLRRDWRRCRGGLDRDPRPRRRCLRWTLRSC